MKITRLSSTLFCSIALGLTACGGGGGGSSSDASNTEPNTTTKHTFDGTWKGSCDYDADLNEADQLTVTINGNVNTLQIKTYKTSDCSDTAFSTVNATFDTQYKGEYATSSCIAEKVDLKATAANINGTVLNATQLESISSTIPPYQLVCIDSTGALRFSNTEGALDGSTPEKRPTTVDMTGTGLIKQ